ncbi:AAA family ATPase [Peribacillus kribbensis]|uniref:AAA family ATPase n=1 Tax=Peribacillus kribbensis TaxID=356658 RepID=UPI00041C8EF1|nr:AAA family ATPase [Peribacillus kribbensis]
MKIKEIHIYGYGKLENRSFTDIKNLQVFFGQNEAGKSTIMSFIHSVLFGFPAKNQNSARYEPKHHSKYGGRLIVETEAEGLVSIERVKGKAAGDVTVAFQNKIAGGEESLKELLKGLDKNTFQSIYSFDLTGLQELQKVNENDIGKFLLSAGMIGNDTLTYAEGKLQKEMDALFKPAGSKPVLNRKLKELRTLQADLNKAMGMQKEYELLLAQSIQDRERLQNLRDKKQEAEQRVIKYRDYLRIKSLLHEQAEQERAAEAGKIIDFPEDGLNRLQELVNLENHYGAELTAQREKLKDVRMKLEQIKPDPLVMEQEAEIERALDHVPALLQAETMIGQIQAQIRAKASENEQHLQEIGSPLSEEEILSLDTGTLTKERISTLERNHQKSLHMKEQLDERLKEDREKLEETEKSISELEHRLLSQEERIKLEQIRKSSQDSSHAEVKRELILGQIERVNKRLKEQKKKVERLKRKQLFAQGASVILMVLSIACLLFFKQYLAGILGGIAAGALFLYRPLKNAEGAVNELKQELAELSSQKEKLEQASRDKGWDFSKQALLDRDIELQRAIQEKKIKYQEQEHAFDKVIDSFERWEVEWKDNEQRIAQAFLELRFPRETHPQYLGLIFTTLKKVKDNSLEIRRLSEQMEEELEKASVQKDKILRLSSGLSLSAPVWREAASELKTVLKSNLDLDRSFRQLLEKAEEAEMQIKENEQKVTYVRNEISELFRAAGAEGEEDFRRIARIYTEAEEALKSLKRLKGQLQNSGLSDREIEEYTTIGVSPYHVHELEESRKQWIQEEDGLIKAIAEAQLKIAGIEEGGTYSELLHAFYQKRSEFQEDAKRWAEYAAAKSLLDRTVDTFKNERLPKIIKKAEEYFSFLTEGQYSSLHLGGGAGGLQLQDKNGTLFEPGEVSRGTSEQAYVSIRLALALSTAEGEPFPIIIDDSFVNFDRERTLRMLQLLEGIKEEAQVIFFTCHGHLLETFSEGDVHILKNDERLPARSRG